MPPIFALFSKTKRRSGAFPKENLTISIMIKYNVVPRKNPITKEVLYYAQALPPTVLSYDNLCERVEKRSTMSHADVLGCLNALQFEMLQALQDGQSVRLGDLGSFHITLQSAGSATADAFTSDNIKRVMVRWTRPRKLRKELTPGIGDVTFEKQGA